MSLELQNAVKSYENYIQVNGIDEQAIDAYIQAVAVALRTEHDVEYGLKLSSRVKKLITQYVKDHTGGRIEDLEIYAGEHDTKYKVLEQFYNVLMYEAPVKIIQKIQNKTIPIFPFVSNLLIVSSIDKPL